MKTSCTQGVLLLGIMLALAPVTLGDWPTWSHDPDAGFDGGDALYLAQLSQRSDHPARHIQAQPLVGRQIPNRVSRVTSYRIGHGSAYYWRDHFDTATTYNDAVFAPPSEEYSATALRPQTDAIPSYINATSAYGIISALRSSIDYYPATYIGIEHHTYYNRYRHYYDGGHHFRRHAYGYRPHYGGSFYYGRHHLGGCASRFGHSGFRLRHGHRGEAGLSVHISY